MLQISEAAKSIPCDVQGATWGEDEERGIGRRKGEKIMASGRYRNRVMGEREDTSLGGGGYFGLL